MLTGLEARLLAIALAVLAILGAYAAWDHHVTEQQRQVDAAAQLARDAKQASANQAERARQTQAQKENADETTRFDQRRADDARDLDRTVQRLRDRYAGQRPAVAADPAASAASAPDGMPPPGMVPADLYFGAVDAAGALARYADCLQSGGELCARDYDALTVPVGP